MKTSPTGLSPTGQNATVVIIHLYKWIFASLNIFYSWKQLKLFIRCPIKNDKIILLLNFSLWLNITCEINLQISFEHNICFFIIVSTLYFSFYTSNYLKKCVSSLSYNFFLVLKTHLNVTYRTVTYRTDCKCCSKSSS